MSGGYAYFIQFICKEVFDAWSIHERVGQRVSVPERDILRKLDQRFFAGRWDNASDRQREFMTVVAMLPSGAHELNIGDAAPDFALPGIDGRTHHLADYKDANLLMIAFISNHCPDSHAAEGRLKQLVADMKGRSFALVAVNPNNPEGLRLDELGYSKYNDGFDDMKKYAAEQGFTFPYLYDGEKQAIWDNLVAQFEERACDVRADLPAPGDDRVHQACPAWCFRDTRAAARSSEMAVWVGQIVCSPRSA